MADGLLTTVHDGACFERRFDGATLVFQRWAEVWMIDRLSARESAEDDAEEAFVAHGASTAVSRDVLKLSTVHERHTLCERQLRRLGLPSRGEGAAVLWRLVSDFDGFVP